MDDIILTDDDRCELDKLNKELAKDFEINDLGTLKYFLGMEIVRSKEGIFVTQRKYTIDLLSETGLLGFRVTETPTDPILKLQHAKAEKVGNIEQFQRLVGRLIYLSHMQPDITFAMSRGHLQVEVYTDAD
ncbi:uncharacterized protein LOC112097816 [Citrus clementina]|uniref:uncharacterized protein LOC112097816 n=1 Tax=Citrus clementina TaxID=85681 RepID=UPI000CED0FA6|nr:uncharacterized protein LOC112097816 [Citrus x clementina]